MFKLAFTFKLPFMVVNLDDLPITTEVAFVVPSARELIASKSEQLIEKFAMFNGVVARPIQLLLGIVCHVGALVPLLVNT